MPDCYYLIAIASEEEGVADRADKKPLDAACDDVRACAETHGGRFKKCERKSGRDAAEARIHYRDKDEAEKNLAAIRDCLVGKGNDVLESRVEDG